MYAYGPARLPHSAACTGSATCILFIAFESAVDAVHAPDAPPIKPAVGHEALEALDIRVGTIVAVEDVPKAAKHVRLIVNFGDHQRRILAGMKKERHDPRETEAGRLCSS